VLSNAFSSDDDSSLSLQDQNRAAQQRYRERQKEKLLQTQQRVEELTAEINRVRIQKVSIVAVQFHASSIIISFHV